MPYRPSYVSRQSGTEKISRATIATAPTMALDSSGSCVLRPLLPGGPYGLTLRKKVLETLSWSG